MQGCEPARKPAPPLAKLQEVPSRVTVEHSPPGRDLADSSEELPDDALLAQVDASHEILSPPKLDMFAAGDRELTLGIGEWVTLSDGRQSKVTYSADGQLLTVDGLELEMFSATFVKNIFTGNKIRVPSRITVEKVLIQGGKLIVKGSSKGLSGETVMSEQETRSFIDTLSKGGTPDFPLTSLVAESGFITKHEQPEESE